MTLLLVLLVMHVNVYFRHILYLAKNRVSEILL